MLIGCLDILFCKEPIHLPTYIRVPIDCKIIRVQLPDIFKIDTNLVLFMKIKHRAEESLN